MIVVRKPSASLRPELSGYSQGTYLEVSAWPIEALSSLTKARRVSVCRRVRVSPKPQGRADSVSPVPSLIQHSAQTTLGANVWDFSLAPHEEEVLRQPSAGHPLRRFRPNAVSRKEVSEPREEGSVPKNSPPRTLPRPAGSPTLFRLCI